MTIQLKLRALYHWALRSQKITGSWEGKTIFLDGAVLRDCEIRNCSLVYAALPSKIVMEGEVSIFDSEILLVGAASRADHFLQFVQEKQAND